MAKIIRNRHGVDYLPAHVSKELAAMGFSCQHPTPALSGDEVNISHRKRHKWPAIKKPSAKGV